MKMYVLSGDSSAQKIKKTMNKSLNKLSSRWNNQQKPSMKKHQIVFDKQTNK